MKKKSPKKVTKSRKNLNPQLERISREGEKEEEAEAEAGEKEEEDEEDDLPLPLPRRSSGRAATKVTNGIC